jgi:hypothetical protein
MVGWICEKEEERFQSLLMGITVRTKKAERYS